jgi:hypothetical protein
MKLKYITRLSLICGVMIIAVALSGCSGSEKAVQANAPVSSSPSVGDTSSNNTNSAVEISSSSLVSTSTPQVSTAVASSSGVVSQKSLNGGASTSHLAPSAGAKASPAKVTSHAPASKPAPVTPASKPAPKPTPKPASKAPAPKPVSTAPDDGEIIAKYHESTYGCADKSQYEYVLEKARAVKGSSKYKSTYELLQEHSSGLEAMAGIPYSDTWNDILSIRAYFGASGTGNPSYGNAYDYFTGANRMCADKSKALEASLHCAGYNARLATGTRAGDPHMWCQVQVDGKWYNLTQDITTDVPAGYTLSATGYNLG